MIPLSTITRITPVDRFNGIIIHTKEETIRALRTYLQGGVEDDCEDTSFPLEMGLVRKEGKSDGFIETLLEQIDKVLGDPKKRHFYKSFSSKRRKKKEECKGKKLINRRNICISRVSEGYLLKLTRSGDLPQKPEEGLVQRLGLERNLSETGLQLGLSYPPDGHHEEGRYRLRFGWIFPVEILDGNVNGLHYDLSQKGGFYHTEFTIERGTFNLKMYLHDSDPQRRFLRSDTSLTGRAYVFSEGVKVYQEPYLQLWISATEDTLTKLVPSGNPKRPIKVVYMPKQDFDSAILSAREWLGRLLEDRKNQTKKLLSDTSDSPHPSLF